MIRLFAPPTDDVVFRSRAVTATNLLLHVAALIALLVPIGRVAKEELLERFVVFLVPPDKAPGEKPGPGAASWSSAAADAGRVRTGAEATGDDARLAGRGTIPTLQASDLIAADRPLPGDNALTALEVDSAVVRDAESAAPDYPANLLARGIEGFASVRYVVDTTGLVDTLTYRVIQATAPDFAVEVRRVLPAMHFRPAIQGGRPVRQLVEQTFRFRIAPTDTAPRPPA
jgi:TonB family protein